MNMQAAFTSHSGKCPFPIVTGYINLPDSQPVRLFYQQDKKLSPSIEALPCFSPMRLLFPPARREEENNILPCFVFCFSSTVFITFAYGSIFRFVCPYTNPVYLSSINLFQACIQIISVFKIILQNKQSGQPLKTNRHPFSAIYII